MEKEMSRVNYDDFITKHRPASQNVYTNYQLVEADQDSNDAVARIGTDANGSTSYHLKRTINDTFFNPLDFDAGTRSDIRFQTASQRAKWVKVSKLTYDKYLEFLRTGSRVALAKAEREFLSL